MRRSVVCLLAAAAFATGAAHAAPIDGTFNYQGRLTSGGAPITGNADVRFSLWDAAGGGAQVGPTLSFLGVPVTGGLFNADLDFGVAALNGDMRWLQIEVRSPAGVGGYVTLGRQEVLGAPYAIQTRGIFVDNALNVGVGTTAPSSRLHVGGPDSILTVWNQAQDDSVIADGRGLFNSPSGGKSVLRHLDAGAFSQELMGATEGGQYHSYNTVTGGLTAGIGTAFNSDSGFFELYDGNGSFSVSAFADKDLDRTNGISEGVIRIGSVGGGEGGELSVRNDSGSETINLLGGGSGATGTVSLFNPSTGDSTITLNSNTSLGGRISTLSEDGFAQAYWEPDVSSGGGVFGVWRRGDSLNGMVLDGNNGSNGSTLSLSGDSSMSFNSGTTGTGSVSLPTDAIQDTEILDEPGVAATHSLGPIVSVTGISVIDSQSITAPTAGYVLVLASCEASKSHTTGTTSSFTFGVSSVSTSLPSDQDFDWVIPSGAATGGYDNVISPHGLFSVAAGTNTFYFLINNFTTGSVTINDVQFTLVFFPTAYGTVDATLMRLAGQTDENTPRSAALTAADIQAEQLQAVAFDQNRRAAEAADYAARFAELEAQLQAVLREQEALRGELRRAAPAPETSGAAVLGHNDATSR